MLTYPDFKKRLTNLNVLFAALLLLCTIQNARLWRTFPNPTRTTTHAKDLLACHQFFEVLVCI